MNHGKCFEHSLLYLERMQQRQKQVITVQSHKLRQNAAAKTLRVKSLKSFHECASVADIKARAA